MHQCAHDTTPVGLLDGDQTGVGEFVHGQYRTDRPLRHRGLEPPQAQQESEAFLPAGGPQSGHQLFSGQRPCGSVTEAITHAGDRVVGVDEGAA